MGPILPSFLAMPKFRKRLLLQHLVFVHCGTVVSHLLKTLRLSDSNCILGIQVTTQDTVRPEWVWSALSLAFKPNLTPCILVIGNLVSIVCRESIHTCALLHPSITEWGQCILPSWNFHFGHIFPKYRWISSCSKSCATYTIWKSNNTHFRWLSWCLYTCVARSSTDWTSRTASASMSLARWWSAWSATTKQVQPPGAILQTLKTSSTSGSSNSAGFGLVLFSAASSTSPALQSPAEDPKLSERVFFGLWFYIFEHSKHLVQAGHCYFCLVQPYQLLWAGRIQDWSLWYDKVR